MTGGLFPFDDTEEFPDLIEEESNEEYIYKDFEIENRKTMRMTGKIVEGRDSIEQWAHIALRTSRYDWLIYSWDFGEEYTELIGYSYSQEYLDNEVERTITECLTENPYISGIEDLTVTVEDSHLHIEFIMLTDFGEVRMDV